MIKWPLKAKLDTKEEGIITILTVVRGEKQTGMKNAENAIKTRNENTNKRIHK